MTEQQHFNIVVPGFELAFDNSKEGESTVKVGFVSNTVTNKEMVRELIANATEIQQIVSGRHISVDGPCSLPLFGAFTRIVGATAPSLRVNAPRENAYIEVYKTND